MIAAVAVALGMAISGPGRCPDPADVARKLAELVPDGRDPGEVKLSPGAAGDGTLRIELGAGRGERPPEIHELPRTGSRRSTDRS